MNSTQRTTNTILTDVSQGLDGRLLEHVAAGGVRDLETELVQQVRPQVERQLCTRDGRHTLRRCRRSVRLRAQCVQNLQSKPRKLNSSIVMMSLVAQFFFLIWQPKLI